MLLVGSEEPIELDATRIAARYNQPEVAAAFREVGIGSPAALLATWVTDRQGLESYAGDAPPVTDDHPRIECCAASLPRTAAIHTTARSSKDNKRHHELV
jgi:spermidine synthase